VRVRAYQDVVPHETASLPDGDVGAHGTEGPHDCAVAKDGGGVHEGGGRNGRRTAAAAKSTASLRCRYFCRCRLVCRLHHPRGHAAVPPLPAPHTAPRAAPCDDDDDRCRDGRTFSVTFHYPKATASFARSQSPQTPLHIRLPTRNAASY
jgi:hypothetical protein